MTQVKEMSNAELNRALAVELGCQVEEHSGTIFFFTICPNGKRLYHQLPDYAGDVAASLEVQTAAIKADYKSYILNLTEIVGSQHPTLDLYISALLTATPRERAEAAYITLSSKQ